MAAVSDAGLADWFDQVADGLGSGMTAANAVALAKPLPRAASEKLASSFETGSSWSEALETVDLGLSGAERAVMHASEVSGKLPEAMRRLAAARRERAETKRRLKLSSIYPVFLLHFAAFVFSVTYLVNGDISAFLVSTGMVVVPFWLIFAFCVAFARGLPSSAKSVVRTLPVFSAYRKFWDSGVFCQTLSSCLEAGMKVESAWEVSVAAADHPQISRMGSEALAAIRAGKRASEGLARPGSRAPRSLLQLYRSGEETGNLAENLAAAAGRYFGDARRKLFFGTLLYPKALLVLILGYVVYKIVMFYKDYFDRIMEMSG